MPPDVDVMVVAHRDVITAYPGFRDPAASSDDVHARAIAWLLGKGVTAVALAAGLVELRPWRRHRGGRGADEFRPRRRSVFA